jgi:hypothetical protein
LKIMKRVLVVPWSRAPTKVLAMCVSRYRLTLTLPG